MDCKTLNAKLYVYLDARLESAVAGDCRAHLAQCDACRARVDWELQLRSELRSLPLPPPSPGFAHRALKMAGRNHPPRPVWHRGVGYALAASLAALAVGVAVWFGLPGTSERTAALAPQMRTVATSQGEVTPVRLVFRSPRDLSGITIELELPDGVEIADRPGLRELSWQANLRAGANVLEVPVVMHGGQGGVMTASISNGRERRQLQVRLKPQGPDARAPDSRSAPAVAATLKSCFNKEVQHA